MANILKQKLRYTRRQITNDGSGLATLFLPETPNHIPEVGQTIVISHIDLPVGSSGIKNKIESNQTTKFTATFHEYIDDVENSDLNDGYTKFFVIKYTDITLASSAGGGSTTGYIQYEVNPEAYSVMKPIENAVIVQESIAFNGTDGHQTLSGTTPVSGDDIFPMLYVERSSTNTVFSNLFKAFNLPVTAEEVADFRQTDLGELVEDVNGDVVVSGVKYNWIAGSGPDAIYTHPDSGVTGTYYNTAYAGLCPEVTGVTYDKAIVIEIPATKYGEIVDGKTIKLTLPKSGGGTYSIYSAYQSNPTLFSGGGLDKYTSEHSLLAANFGTTPDLDGGASTINTDYQSNVVLLFSDEIRKPKNDSTKSWGTGHTEVIDGEKVYYDNATTTKERFDLDEDIAVGIAYLDKGFIVLTNNIIVDDMYDNHIDGGTNVDFGSDAHSSLIDNTEDIDSQFLFQTGTSSTLEYLSYNSEKSLNIVCLASTDEFFRTTNSTAKELLGVESTADYADLKASNSDNLFPVIITELGLHDENGELLAICKPTTPVDKYWYDVVSFNIKIRL